MKMLMLASMMTSWGLISLSHPMMMVIVISLQTLILCLLLLTLTQTTWFSFILFLVFMGGLMVLFIYISSLASNESFSVELSGNYLLTGLGVSAMAVLVNNLINAQSIKMLQVTATNTIFKIYSPNMASLTFLTMIFLLLALVVIVSITSMKEGPLRSMSA